MPPALRPVQRTAAYAVVRDSDDATLLVRASRRSDLPGSWFLPGGGVRHGEDPREAVIREVAEETGLHVVVTAVRSATADMLDLPHRGVRLHTLRILYDAVPAAGVPRRVDGRPRLRPEPDGTSDRAEFVLTDVAARVQLMPFVADVLGLPRGRAPDTVPPERPESLNAVAIDAAQAADLDEPLAPEPAGLRSPDEVPVPYQRPAAYAVLFRDDQVLLTRLRNSGEMWTLPGGGIDHGEEPPAALTREVFEETGLTCEPGPLIAVSSRHFTGRAPDGRLEDFHGIRLIYSGTVPVDVEPRVTETDGSTDEVAWTPLAALSSLHLGDSVLHGLGAAGLSLPD